MQLAEEASSTPLSEQDHRLAHLLLADWPGARRRRRRPGSVAARRRRTLHRGRHCRPATSTTVHVDDIIGLHLPAAREIDLRRALQSGEVVRSPAARWAGTYSMMETCVPVCRDGRIIAVVTREANLSSPRLSLGFEGWTVAAADTLCQMMARGEYPYDSTPQVTSHGVPRVLDGAVLLDAEGRVQHATPNAVSCLRRLGIRTNVTGKVLAQEITEVIGDGTLIEESMAVVVMAVPPGALRSPRARPPSACAPCPSSTDASVWAPSS